jgi:hypothetical protein
MMKRPSPTIERLLAGAGLTGAFLFMASVFVPQPGSTEAGPSPLPSAADETSAVSLGWIEDDFYRAHILASDPEPLYTVYDRIDGRELGARMTAEEVSRSFPDLPITSMDFGTETAIMLAEPMHLDW